LGVTEPVVRTFIREEEENTQQGFSGVGDDEVSYSKKVKIVGALCTLDSGELSVDFTTPAVLLVSKFKGKPTKLRINCQKGDLKTDFEVKPQLVGLLSLGHLSLGWSLPMSQPLLPLAKTTGFVAPTILLFGSNSKLIRQLKPLLRSEGCSRDLLPFETINFTQ
jgi:hypothetical protein